MVKFFKWYFLIGMIVFYGVLLFKLFFNKETMKFTITQVIGLLLIFTYTLATWPLCLALFIYGLKLRIQKGK